MTSLIKTTTIKTRMTSSGPVESLKSQWKSRLPLLHIVLHEPEIPPNTGNVGRTCLAIGAKLWLVEPLGFDVSEKARRRAGLDYWKNLDWEVVPNWDACHVGLRENASPNLYFFSKRANQSLYEVEFQKGDVLVFGSETRGLPDSLITANAERTVRIPIQPPVRSLNLSAAVAVVAFEAVRQMGLRGDVELGTWFGGESTVSRVPPSE